MAHGVTWFDLYIATCHANQGARVSSATLVEVDECSQMDEMSDVEENAEHAVREAW